MTYYAVYSPRGFANELTVCTFADRYSRDNWVWDHNESDPMADRAAHAIPAKEAVRLLRIYTAESGPQYTYDGTR